jgi:hypothetical protein
MSGWRSVSSSRQVYRCNYRRSHFQVESLFLGKVNFERPHLVIAVGDPANQAMFTGSVDEQQTLYGVSVLSFPIGLATLSRLESASRIVARVFSIEFPLFPDDTRAVAEFSRRARRNPNRTSGHNRASEAHLGGARVPRGRGYEPAQLTGALPF